MPRQKRGFSLEKLSCPRYSRTHHALRGGHQVKKAACPPDPGAQHRGFSGGSSEGGPSISLAVHLTRWSCAPGERERRSRSITLQWAGGCVGEPDVPATGSSSLTLSLGHCEASRWWSLCRAFWGGTFRRLQLSSEKEKLRPGGW